MKRGVAYKPLRADWQKYVDKDGNWEDRHITLQLYENTEEEVIWPGTWDDVEWYIDIEELSMEPVLYPHIEMNISFELVRALVERGEPDPVKKAKYIIEEYKELCVKPLVEVHGRDAANNSLGGIMKQIATQLEGNMENLRNEMFSMVEEYHGQINSSVTSEPATGDKVSNTTRGLDGAR